MNKSSSRPFVILKTAMSLDGHIDDLRPDRLLLSTEGDQQAVDRLRAEVDAILVGANTIRRDDPALVLRQQKSRRNPPLKVTLTSSGKLPTDAKFFSSGTAEKLVYCTNACHEQLQKQLANVAECIAAGEKRVSLQTLLADLRRRGIAQLLVEGGSEVIRQFLAEGLVDKARLAISPLIVAQPEAPRFLPKGCAGVELGGLHLESAKIEHGMLVVNLLSSPNS